MIAGLGTAMGWLIIPTCPSSSAVTAFRRDCIRMTALPLSARFHRKFDIAGFRSHEWRYVAAHVPRWHVQMNSKVESSGPEDDADLRLPAKAAEYSLPDGTELDVREVPARGWSLGNDGCSASNAAWSLLRDSLESDPYWEYESLSQVGLTV